jgi:hypothetical protein
MKLIDKDALVAEIERRIKYYENIQMIKPVYESNIEDFNELLSFIDTLEVKEVDLEKETKKWWKEHLHLNPENKLWMDAHQSVKLAKHFFELGLRASQSTVSVYGIEEALKENGIDPDSKEADMYREAIYKIYDRLQALKGE